MGTYDPLGLVSPALLHGKLLLRRLYAPHIKTGWDCDLPQDEKRSLGILVQEPPCTHGGVLPKVHQASRSGGRAQAGRVWRCLNVCHLCCGLRDLGK